MIHKLLGMLLILAGDIVLLKEWGEKKKRSIRTLQELILITQNITCNVNELKIPLAEAVKKEEKTNPTAAILYRMFHSVQTMDIRQALIGAIRQVPFLPKESCELLTDYFQILGALPKESAEPLYHTTIRKLEALSCQLEQECFRNKKIVSGAVCAISCVSVIILL